MIPTSQYLTSNKIQALEDQRNHFLQVVDDPSILPRYPYGMATPRDLVHEPLAAGRAVAAPGVELAQGARRLAPRPTAAPWRAVTWRGTERGFQGPEHAEQKMHKNTCECTIQCENTSHTLTHFSDQNIQSHTENVFCSYLLAQY